MGDVRFRHAYARLAQATDRARVVRSMGTEDLVMALSATSVERDPLIVNVLATELQNRVRRTSAAIENIAEGVLVVDPAGYITYANPTALRLLARPGHEVVGRVAESIALLGADGDPLSPEDRPSSRALTLGETSSTREVLLERPDGTRFPISILAAPIVAEGDVLGAVLAIRDITAERRAEAALGFHRQLLDAVGEAVVATDLAGHITYWNAGAERLYGWRADQVRGRSIVDVTPSETSRDEAEEIMATLRQGGSWSGVFAVRGHEGPSFLARVTNAPVVDDAGRLVGIVGISRPLQEASPRSREPATPK